MGKSGSEVSYFIPEQRNFAEVIKLSVDIQKHWLKATLKEINILIKNQTFLVQEPDKGDTLTPCMDVYKAKIHSCGILDKLKLRFLVRRDLKNKELVGDTWSPTASNRTLKYFFADAVYHKTRFYHFAFIGAFLQTKVKNRVFFKLDNRYV